MGEPRLGQQTTPPAHPWKILRGERQATDLCKLCLKKGKGGQVGKQHRRDLVYVWKAASWGGGLESSL